MKTPVSKTGYLGSKALFLAFLPSAYILLDNTQLPALLREAELQIIQRKLVSWPLECLAEATESLPSYIYLKASFLKV